MFCTLCHFILARFRAKLLTILFKTGTADAKEKSDFMKEIEMMKKVSKTDDELSLFVVNMLGCCTTEEPLLLVLEFIKYGNLLDYLRATKKALKVSSDFIL